MPISNPIPALKLALSDIKFAHSVFALPFAILAAVMVADRTSATHLAGQLTLIVACMVAARTWAMLVNRLADRRFDADNPRTACRAIASGALSARHGWTIASAAAALFILCCAGFILAYTNPWPLIFSVPVLGWIALYSYTKRFTALSHLFLGGALAISPIAAAIAIESAVIFNFTPNGKAIVALAGFVLLWVAGFDIAYALQDIDFDRRTKLHSIPAALGPRASLWISRILHAAAFLLLMTAWNLAPRLGTLTLIALLAIGAILVLEHIMLARQGVAGLPLAFFTLNGVVSVVLGVTGCLDVLL